MFKFRTLIGVASLVAICCLYEVLAQYEWQAKDAVDEVRHRMDKVTL